MVNQVREPKRDKIVEAYAERRRRLRAQVTTDYPSYSEVEVEARLEQFGA
jgi:hypothetical protein